MLGGYQSLYVDPNVYCTSIISIHHSSCNKSVERDSQVRKDLKQPEMTPAPKRHYNPRIANALDQMIAMGFSDNDGWLTELLVRKHGDIVQAS